MATFYGSDTVCVTDVPLIDIQTSDPFLVIGQRIARLLTMPRSAFASINDDPTRGWDSRQYLLGKMNSTTIAEAQRQIQAECLKDEQVLSATVTPTVVGGVLQSFSIQLVAAAGPFKLTANVNQLTGALIFSF